MLDLSNPSCTESNPAGRSQPGTISDDWSFEDTDRYRSCCPSPSRDGTIDPVTHVDTERSIAAPDRSTVRIYIASSRCLRSSIGLGRSRRTPRHPKVPTALTSVLSDAMDDRCLARRTGGAERDRTDDLLLAKQALSQLSYSPVSLWWFVIPTDHSLAGCL